MLKSLCITVAASVLLSCTAARPPPVRPSPQPSPSVERPPPVVGVPAAGVPATGTPPAPMPPAGTYQIDSSLSELRVLVYKTGALADLGHNHVILNRSVNGSIEVGPTLERSSFSISAAVSACIVDDADARAEEGEDFPGEISDSAKLGTWNNLTGSAVLNSLQYPIISVRSIRVEELQGVPTATVLVSVAGHDTSLLLPFVLRKEAYGLSATAAFEVRQSALGLTPFSLMLGALAVRDEIEVKMKVIAQLGAPH